MILEAPTTFVVSRFIELSPRTFEETVLLGTRIDETGIESLELLELLMLVEDHFEIVVDDSVLRPELTVGELCGVISGLVGAKN